METPEISIMEIAELVEFAEQYPEPPDPKMIAIAKVALELYEENEKLQEQIIKLKENKDETE